MTMAELASAYPTSGGMYFWQYVLSGPRWGPVACWVTGWLNLLGQIAAVASVSFLLTELIATTIDIGTGINGGTAVVLDEKQSLGIFAGLLALSAVLNSCGLHVLTFMTQAGGIFHLVGVLVLVVVLPAIAPQRQSASYVFTHFETAQAEAVGITNPFYIAILGLLLPGFSYTGMDGPAHMSEETSGSTTGPPLAIMSGVSIMFFGGGAMILSLLFSMPSLERALDPDSPSGGDPVPQILYDVFAARVGPAGGVAVQIIPILGVFFCLVATHTYVARILFCYARDHAVPLPWLWARVDKRTNVPLAAVWGIALGAFLLGLPVLGSVTAFNAVLSLSTISLVIIYTTPTLARITWGRKRFTPGPFHLGWWAYPVGAVACSWAVFAAVVFCLPTAYPVTSETLNYASVAFLGTTFISLLWFYCPGIGAYRWFKGPFKEVDAEVVVTETITTVKVKEMVLPA